MATISRQKAPRALARTGRWAEPGSKSAAPATFAAVLDMERGA